jgi:hypothetical protein
MIVAALWYVMIIACFVQNNVKKQRKRCKKSPCKNLDEAPHGVIVFYTEAREHANVFQLVQQKCPLMHAISAPASLIVTNATSGLALIQTV